MSATVTSPDPLMWSNCSIRELQQGLEIQGLGSCLTNDPVIVFTDPLCGNGIRETGEACDCGSQEVGLHHSKLFLTSAETLIFIWAHLLNGLLSYCSV